MEPPSPPSILPPPSLPPPSHTCSSAPEAAKASAAATDASFAAEAFAHAPMRSQMCDGMWRLCVCSVTYLGYAIAYLRPPVYADLIGKSCGCIP